jgi:tRNA(Ile)-lysidine synthase
MPSLAPAPNLIARFRRDCEALAGEPERLGLAVSGGPDSLALLLLAAAAFPGRISAATVDHGLRTESAAEALHVEHICDRLGCPHTILTVDVPCGPAGVQGEARGARYAALARWAAAEGIAHLATAHHEDDQAETLLMRLQRGSGIAGLSGIRPIRREADLLILRPLLGWTKAELVHIVGQAGIEAADDPSNSDPRFDRSAIRAFLRANPQFQPGRLARTAAAAREADEALGWAADQLAEDRITTQGGEWRVDPSGLPRALKRRLLARAIAEVRREHGIDPPWTGAEDVDGLLATLEAGGAGTLAGIMARGDAVWHLRPAPPRRAVGSPGG